MSHDTELCAALGHFIATQAVIYCPHHQQWTLVHSAGNDSDDTIYEHGTWPLGPFDGPDEVLTRSRALLSSAVLVRLRQFLAELDRSDGSTAEPGEETF